MNGAGTCFKCEMLVPRRMADSSCNPGSQPPVKKWWFLLDDDKPLLQKKNVKLQLTYKKQGLDFHG